MAINSLTEFKEREILPRLLRDGYIKNAFPGYDFKENGDKWITSYHVSGNRSKSSRDQSYIYKNGNSLIDNNGDKIGLIDLYMRESNETDIVTALRSLADICGIGYLFPEFDSEEFKAYTEIQEKRREANARFISALWNENNEEAKKVLAYLRSRKWEDEEIKLAGLGYADEELIKLLPYSDTHRKEDGKENTLLGRSHRLTIPYEGGSTLYGFKFRDIDYNAKVKEAESRGDKYSIAKYQNTTGLSKNADFFAIPVTATEIVIVEGELDALHARVKGAKNVVATTGGRATDSQIESALKRGVNRFNLLYDNDPAGRGYIDTSIEAIENRGGEVSIAYLPDVDETTGEKIKDADDYFKTHSLEDWNKIIENATPSYYYKYDLIKEKYIDLQKKNGERNLTEDGGLTLKQREDLFSDIEKLLNSPSMISRPHNRELVKSLFRELEPILIFKLSDFEEWADRAYLRKQAEDRRNVVENASKCISNLLKEGKTDEALKLMRETGSKQTAQDKATEFAKVFSPLHSSDFDSYLSEIPDGIPTGITFKDKRNETKLTLNSGLTFICGYRGHGKTSFLNNIALNEVRRNLHHRTGKSVLYFSYEVDRRRLITDLLNTFVNDPELQRSRTPIDAIHGYFKGYGDRFFNSRDKRADGFSHYDYFIKKKVEFQRDYLDRGNLIIVDEPYKVEELLEAIRYYLTICSPSIVCIDYAQLIYSEDYSRLRTEEIKKVVNDIKDFANKEGIPFILAAQFNREVSSPISVDTRNIGEGGDFERIADTCIGLFNLKELLPISKKNGGKDEETETKKLLSRLLNEDITELSPRDNKIFVRLMKRRYGYYPLDTILDWEGRTKKIFLNDEKELLRRPEDALNDVEETSTEYNTDQEENRVAF